MQRGDPRHRRTLHAVRHRLATPIAARRRAISVMHGLTTAATTAARRRARPHAVRHRRIIATVGLRRVTPIGVRRRAISAMCGVTTGATTAGRRRATLHAVRRRRIIAIADHRRAMLIVAHHRHAISAMRAATQVTAVVLLRLRVKPRVTPRRRATIVARRHATTVTSAATIHALIAAVRRRARLHAAGLRRAITVARRPAVLAVAIPRTAAPCCVNMSVMPAASSRSSGTLVAPHRRGFRRPRATATLTIAGSSALSEARDRLHDLVVEAVEAVGGASLTRIAGVDAAV